MANANRPTGLSPVKYLGGADWDGKVNIYFLSSADGNALFPGDPVVLSGNGDTVRGIPGITIGVAGAAIVGVAISIGVNPDGGPYIDPNNLTLTSAPATKTQNYYVAVCDDPNVIFEMQEVGTGTFMTSADIALNANFVAAAPATGVKYSGYTIDNTTKNTTSTLNLKLLGLVRRLDNAFGQYSKWLVLINNHLYRGGITGV